MCIPPLAKSLGGKDRAHSDWARLSPTQKMVVIALLGAMGGLQWSPAIGLCVGLSGVGQWRKPPLAASWYTYISKDHAMLRYMFGSPLQPITCVDDAD